MINVLKKAFFGFYLFLTRFKSLPVRALTFKFGQWIIRPMGTAVYTFKGCKFRLTPLNMIDKLVIAGKGHDVFVEEQIQAQLSDGGVFIDVGANFGYFSIIAAKTSDKVKVLAYEPSMKELLKLYDHVLLNNARNIHVFPMGMADKPGVQKLYYGPERNTGTNSLVVDNNMGYTEALFAPASNTIPEEFLPQARLCKIDVEGYELFVLNGMRTVMPKLTNCNFVIEISPDFLAKVNHTVQDIYDFFKEFGYSWKSGPSSEDQYDEIFYKA